MTLLERMAKMIEYDKKGDKLWARGHKLSHEGRLSDGRRLKGMGNDMYAKADDLFEDASLIEQNQIGMLY